MPERVLSYFRAVRSDSDGDEGTGEEDEEVGKAALPCKAPLRAAASWPPRPSCRPASPRRRQPRRRPSGASGRQRLRQPGSAPPPCTRSPPQSAIWRRGKRHQAPAGACGSARTRGLTSTTTPAISRRSRTPRPSARGAFLSPRMAGWIFRLRASAATLRKPGAAPELPARPPLPGPQAWLPRKPAAPSALLESFPFLLSLYLTRNTGWKRWETDVW